jgi:NAD(P)-dependent dehydrogenase (short-subunit alcohol dehydrogenase family)
MSVAVITGASRGLGFELAVALSGRGWSLVVDARDGDALALASDHFIGGNVIPVAGDVSDAAHREDLLRAARSLGRVDVLVNNASVLGPSPLLPLTGLPVSELERILSVNTVAPLALAQGLMDDLLVTHGAIVNVTSDAAVEAYEGWGGYGSSKAALEQITAILGAEQPALDVYAFDPGDMRTAMHQEAFPGEDISDRPEPATVVPSLLRLLDQRPPSGRYKAVDLLAAAGAVS